MRRNTSKNKSGDGSQPKYEDLLTAKWLPLPFVFQVSGVLNRRMLLTSTRGGLLRLFLLLSSNQYQPFGFWHWIGLTDGVKALASKLW